MINLKLSLGLGNMRTAIRFFIFFLFTGISLPSAKTKQLYQVENLKKPVQIIIDNWGVPHIYANDHYDTFFAQGFNAARDRLWQIDTWRRRGLGQLSEVLGEEYIEQDAATRLFLYRGDMYSEWLAYGNDAKRITQSFVAGINAFVDLTYKSPELLPEEFQALDYLPSRWAAEDVVRIRSHGLWRNVRSEVWRARLACRSSLSLTHQWKVLQPAWETKIPDGLDPCTIPEDVLNIYDLATRSVDFKRIQKSVEAYDLSSNNRPVFRENLGSNNWVVSGNRTKSGRPILADDPHRSHAVPSLRYIAHLVGPDINVIGAGEPALPGISIGHNENIAFGLTIFPIDQEDLYVYQRKGNGYEYKGKETAFKQIEEQIKVKGKNPVKRILEFTSHGPVVAKNGTHAFAVGAAWLLPGMAPYFGSIEYMRAKDFRTFIGALNRWGAPSENQVYADIEGNIGYKPAGRFPNRPNWDGLLPVPGNGTYEWDGFFDMDVLPEEYNPERGFTGTANALSLPANYPIEKYKVGFEWSAPWRHQRLWEVLEGQPQHTISDSISLQTDYLSILAREIISQLPSEKENESHAGLRLLKNWNFELQTDSPEATLWIKWFNDFLQPALIQLLANETSNENPQLDSLTVLKMLQQKEARAVALSSLNEAHLQITASLGEDLRDWSWGNLHKIKFKHPLAELDDFNAKPIEEYPRGGSSNTTNNTGFGPRNFDVKSGASFRMIVDVGDWDAALMTNAPGQSGDQRSPFYDNLLSGWANDEYFPLLYSKDKILERAAKEIILKPVAKQN